MPPPARKDQRDLAMNVQSIKRALVVAIAGATAFGAITPGWSAPVMTSAASVAATVPLQITDVRYYRGGNYRGHHNNNGAAIALGVLGFVGAVAAASAYRHNGYGYNRGYRDPRGYGNPGYYGQPYNGYGYYRGY
jgi:hypothetical protein